MLEIRLKPREASEQYCMSLSVASFCEPMRSFSLLRPKEAPRGFASKSGFTAGHSRYHIAVASGCMRSGLCPTHVLTFCAKATPRHCIFEHRRPNDIDLLID